MVNTADISRNGYFIFPDQATLDSFQLYAIGHTHSQVKTFLSNLGFSSYGATLYSSYTTQTVTQEQANDYILDANLVVQIGNVLYRPIPSASCSSIKWDFVLTMDKFVLDGDNLALLQAGNYDSTSMNQFATNSSDTTFTVENFMAATPYGHKESTPNICPTGLTLRPMFGTTHSGYTQCGQAHYSGDGGCVQDCATHSVSDSYVFWIHTGHSDLTTGSYSTGVPQGACN